MLTDPVTAARALRLAAPAKLNLSLAVTGRRPDGRHDLAGAMVLLELADQLTLLPGQGGLRLSGATRGVPGTRGENLAWLGLAAGLGAEAERSALELRKRIPAAAGLGGGSSDAAAAWRMGRAFNGQDAAPTPDELARLAAIGADVPFFAAGVPAAYVTGIGERVAPIPAPDPARWVILVVPAFRLATAAVFAELRKADWTRQPPPREALPGENDLLIAARRLRPEIGEIHGRMAAEGLDPHLTGSGPTLFALSDDAELLAGAAGRLREAGLEVIESRLATAAPAIHSEEVP